MLNFPAKMGPRDIGNGETLNLTMDSSSWTSKTTIMQFDKFLENSWSNGFGGASIVFLVLFYIRKGHISGNFRIVQIWKTALIIVRAFFRVTLSTSFALTDTSVIGVFEVHELESGDKIKLAQFPVSLRRLHRFSPPILHMEREHLRKFSNRPNLGKYPYYSNGIFLGQYIEFVRFAGNIGYKCFRGSWTRIRLQS